MPGGGLRALQWVASCSVADSAPATGSPSGRTRIAHGVSHGKPEQAQTAHERGARARAAIGEELAEFSAPDGRPGVARGPGGPPHKTLVSKCVGTVGRTPSSAPDPQVRLPRATGLRLKSLVSGSSFTPAEQACMSTGFRHWMRVNSRRRLARIVYTASFRAAPGARAGPGGGALAVAYSCC